MNILLLAKLLGLFGVVMLSIPVIRDGRLFLVFSSLGKTAQSPDLIIAIENAQQQFKENMIRLRQSDLRMIYVGLSAVIISYALEIFELVFLSA